MSTCIHHSKHHCLHETQRRCALTESFAKIYVARPKALCLGRIGSLMGRLGLALTNLVLHALYALALQRELRLERLGARPQPAKQPPQPLVRPLLSTESPPRAIHPASVAGTSALPLVSQRSSVKYSSGGGGAAALRLLRLRCRPSTMLVPFSGREKIPIGLASRKPDPAGRPMARNTGGTPKQRGRPDRGRRQCRIGSREALACLHPVHPGPEGRHLSVLRHCPLQRRCKLALPRVAAGDNIKAD